MSKEGDERFTEKLTAKLRENEYADTTGEINNMKFPWALPVAGINNKLYYFRKCLY